MSHQVNLSSKEIANAYQDVINGELDWAIFTYEGGTNDLKVQSTGGGGLEDLEEEFSDGRCVFHTIRFDDPSQNLFDHSLRIQYAFARVIDPNVSSFITILFYLYLYRLCCRVNFQNLFRSTGVEMAFLRQRKAFSIPIPTQSLDTYV